MQSFLKTRLAGFWILACCSALTAQAGSDSVSPTGHGASAPSPEEANEPTEASYACATRASAMGKEASFREFFKKLAGPAKLNTERGAKDYVQQAKPLVAKTAASLASASLPERAAWLAAAELSHVGTTPEDSGPSPADLCTQALRHLQGRAAFADLLLIAIKGPALSPPAAAFDAVLRAQYGTTYSARRTEAVGTIAFNEGDRLNLTDEELTAIYSYTLGDYRPLNRALRGKAPDELLEFKPYADLVIAGLNKLPAYRGPLTRIDTLPPAVLKQHVPGATLTYASFTSTTKGHITGKNSAQVLYIKGIGKGHVLGGISFWPNENEVLFPPGTRFRVIAKQPAAENPGTLEIEMEELP